MRVRLLAIVTLVLVATSMSGCNVLPGQTRAAETYLKDTYPHMLVEIDYQGGKAPRQEAVSLLKTRIQERCNKPDGVQVDQQEIAVTDSVWTVDDLKEAEDKHRDHQTGGRSAALYILYVGGSFAQERSGGKVIGVMYTRTSIAIFKDTLEQAANPLRLPVFTASDIERSVIVHEFGHTLGLVNLGTPMVRPHEDTSSPDHAGHSSNKESVMYWAIESDAITSVFTGPPPTQFDADDIADLKAAGGK